MQQYDDTQLNCWNWLLTASCHAAIVLLVTIVIIRNYTNRKKKVQIDLLHRHNVNFENPYLIAIEIDMPERSFREPCEKSEHIVSIKKECVGLLGVHDNIVSTHH